MTVRSARPRALWWLLVVPPLTSSAVMLAVLSWTSGGFSAAPVDAMEVGVVLGNVIPGVGLAAITAVMLAGRARLRTRVALLVGGLVFLAFVGLTLAAVVWDSSSTGALAFLFLPLPLGVLVFLTVVIALVLQARRVPARGPDGVHA